MPGEKPAEASLDWKPNEHTAPGPGIEPGLSGPQCRGSAATVPTDIQKLQHFGLPTVQYSKEEGVSMGKS